VGGEGGGVNVTAILAHILTLINKYLQA
jgi:hypothetical protein